MKTYVYLFFCLFSLMGFQACSNDEVDNVKTTTSNDVEAVSASSSLITSEEAKNSYNDKILTISQTRNGCSLSIGGAGIIWGTAFGALSMGAGAAASLVFLLMAEALC